MSFTLVTFARSTGFRRSGVGTMLFKAMLAALPDMGVSHVDAQTPPDDRHENPKLIGWHRAHGFR